MGRGGFYFKKLRKREKEEHIRSPSLCSFQCTFQSFLDMILPVFVFRHGKVAYIAATFASLAEKASLLLTYSISRFQLLLTSTPASHHPPS